MIAITYWCYAAFVFGILFQIINSIGFKKSLSAVGFAILAGTIFALYPDRGAVSYDWPSHIQRMPIISVFMLLAAGAGYVVFVDREKHRKRRAEGGVLLMWMAVSYLSFEIAKSTSYWWTGIAAVLPCFYPLWHILLGKPLETKVKNRMNFLSGLGAMVLGGRACFNLVAFHSLENMVFSQEYSKISLGLIQFFAFGMSSFYLTENFVLIWIMLKGKESEYSYEIKMRSLAETFSSTQVQPATALSIVISCSLFWTFNYFYRLLSPDMAVWFALALVPFLAPLLERRYQSES